MLRIHGDRASLLAALTAHWANQQLQIPQALRHQLHGLAPSTSPWTITKAST